MAAENKEDIEDELVNYSEDEEDTTVAAESKTGATTEVKK
jgi:hypothetical protein